MTPAATCPASLLSAPIPHRSSTNAHDHDEATGQQQALAIFVSVNTLLRPLRRLATSSAAASPP